MAFRSILHISRRTVQVVLATILLLVVLFFALTRTQVGRDALRDQIEEQFAEAFAGRLEIDRLDGNLVQDLYARGVRLYDDAGRLVADVDSVVAQPRWTALLSRDVSLRRLTLHHPQIHLRRAADGTWNVADALRSRGPSDTTGAQNPLSLSVPSVRLVDGTVVTANDGAVPDAVRSGWLFNYADTRLRQVDAEATVEWQPDDVRQVSLHDFSATLADPQVPIEQLQGQFTWEGDRLSLGQMHLRAGATDLKFSLAADGLTTNAEPTFDLNLASSRIDWTQVHRLVPRWPLRDGMTLAAQVNGPLSGLVVERLAAERGASRVEATGTVLDLPAQADFEVRVREAVLEARDVQAAYPPADVTALERLGRVRADVYARGVAALDEGSDAPPLRTETELTLRSEAGRLSGTVALDQPRGRPLTYEADLRADTLDLSRLFPEDAAPRTRITGRIEVNGRGTTREQVAGAMRLQLENSLLAGRHVGALDADLAVDDQRLDGTATLRQAGGMLRLEGSVDAGSTVPAAQVEATAQQLDLGPLLLRDSLRTRLSGTLSLDATGPLRAPQQGRLALALDTSRVTWRGAERIVPATQHTLTLAPTGSSAPRLHLRGDALAFTARTNAAVRPVRALADLWGPALVAAVRAQIDKPYAARTAEAESEGATGGALPVSAEARAAVRTVLAEAGVPDGVDLTADLRVKRPAVLAALLPPLDALTPGLRAELNLMADADRMETRGTVRADTLRLGRVHTANAAGTFEARAALDAPLAETLTLTADARADTLRIGDEVGFRDPILALSYYDRTGELQLVTGSDEQAGPLRLEAGLDLLPDRNRLTLRSVLLETGPYTWTNPSARPVDLYADAIDVPGLLLVSEVPEAQRVQTVRLRGTFSGAPGDTLTVDAGDILLSSLSNLASLNNPIGGLLNGRVALTGGVRKPELTGSVEVERLSFDRRLLGHLEAESRYVPGSPEIALDARLRPAQRDSLALPPGDAPLQNEESALSVAGTFRLPRLDATGRYRYDPQYAGALDLALDVERADLFFFEYIFDDIVADTDGHLTGTGSVGGTFRDPMFGADLRAVGGRFAVPEFGLSYGLEGPVRVDQRGIHLSDALLSSADDGHARIDGSILFNSYEYFSFDLAAQLDRLQIIDVERSLDLPFYGDIRASGRATLRGPLYGATLRAPNARTTPDSELFLPIDEAEATAGATDTGYIIFADSTGQLPDFDRVTRRANVLADRPAGERAFLDGMEMDLNITAPQGSTVHLVFDPLLGDVINAVGSGRLQLLRQEGQFSTFGTFEATSGDYLFTAGDVFQRRFQIESGTISWDGPPANALLDLTAAYRTRASTAGLQEIGSGTARIPVVVRLGITERVQQPAVDLSLAIDRDNRGLDDDYTTQALETILNEGERETEYATSVLLTNTFLLTTDLPGGGSQELTTTGNRLAFNSVSQLVTSQLNRYLSEALPNVDFNFGVQGGQTSSDLDVIYGVALRLLDERLVIRGEGVVESGEDQAENQGLEGEFVVELRLSSSVSVEAFYRREGSILTEQALTSTTGAGLSYQTQYATWRRLVERLFGWLLPGSLTDEEDETSDPSAGEAVARGDAAWDEDPAETAPRGP